MSNSNINELSTTIRSLENRIVVESTPNKVSPITLLSHKALNVLYEIGFEEEDDLTDLLLVDIVSVPGGGPKIAKEILRFRESKCRKEFSQVFTQEENWTVLQFLISISRVRTKNVIASMSPQTVIEFVNLSWETILATRSCGRETYDQIFGLQSELRWILVENPNISANQLLEKIAS
jgi:hypothetical protein